MWPDERIPKTRKIYRIFALKSMNSDPARQRALMAPVAERWGGTQASELHE